MSEDPTRTRVTPEPTRTRVTADPRELRSAAEPTELRPAADPTQLRSVADDTEQRPVAEPTQTRARPDSRASIPASGSSTAAEETSARPASAAPPPLRPASSAPRAAAVDEQVPFGEGYALRGRYVLDTMIGKGAMGQVWKAKDLLSERARGRNPYVAIKVLTSDYEEHPRAFEAMQREASRAQELAHPNVVTVHVFDQDDRGGRVFIAMELLSGRPLDRVIRDTNGYGLPPAEAWPIILGVAEGLAYAHRKGIVHSDLKPANVFLTGDGVPKVLDFGIARAAKQADGGAAVPDDDSVMSGYTATYAAPEVFDDAPPHTADDVFALGTVAYELLTGRHPFGRKPANEARVAKLRPQPIKGLSRRQWRAIERALSFERATRLPDASAFLRALQGVTRLQIGLAAAVVVLTAAAAFLWYRNYVQNQPAVAFDQLPLAEQQYVQRALVNGNEAMDLVKRSNVIEATADAADSFADAYEHHPRNPDAVAGLNEAADHFIEWSEKQPDREMALRELRNFQSKSPYYAKYGPLESAIRSAEAK